MSCVAGQRARQIWQGGRASSSLRDGSGESVGGVGAEWSRELDGCLVADGQAGER